MWCNFQKIIQGDPKFQKTRILWDKYHVLSHDLQEILQHNLYWQLKTLFCWVNQYFTEILQSNNFLVNLVHWQEKSSDHLETMQWHVLYIFVCFVLKVGNIASNMRFIIIFGYPVHFSKMHQFFWNLEGRPGDTWRP